MRRSDEVAVQWCDEVLEQLTVIRDAPSWDLSLQQENLIDLLVTKVKLIKGHVENV